jgi:DNA polymerase I-like protein with 3'-5' exonuclease and polymerase domains/uracil-DNA glycosylase
VPKQKELNPEKQAPSCPNGPRDASHLCQGCPIRTRVGYCDTVGPYYPPQKAKAVKYVLIAESPGKTEVEQQTHLVGPPGQFFREVAETAKLDLQHHALITSGVACPPRQSAHEQIFPPEQAETDHCIAHALRYLTVLPTPPIVIAIGGTVYKALTGNLKSSVVRDRGQWFKMSLSPALQYHVFRLWVKQPFVQARIQAIDEADGKSRATTFLGSLLNPEHQAESCQSQIDYAKEHLDYSEAWMDYDCMPVVSPGFILRQGRYGQQYENLKLDLEKVRMRVTGETYVKADVDYEWLETAQDFADFVDETIALHEAGKLKVMGADIETDFAKDNKVGLSSYDPSIDIVSLQFSHRQGHGRAVLLQHPLSKNNNPLSMRMIVSDLKRLLKEVPAVWQNGTFDFNTQRCRLGVEEWNMSGDTLLMEHWLNAGKQLLYNLDDMGARYCGTGKHKSEAKQWLKDNPGKEYKDMPLDIALDYGCGDTDVTLQIYWKLRKAMERIHPVEGDETTMWQFYQAHFYGENQGWRVIADLEYYGMHVDQDVLGMLNVEYPKRMAESLEALMALPRMQEEWLRKDYAAYKAELLALNVEISMEHAAGKKRRRIRKIKLYEEWEKEMDTGKNKDRRKNWFNPNSTPQTLRLWKETLGLTFGTNADGSLHFTDLEYSDEECPKCRKSPNRCKCTPTHFPINPKATDHNRKIILDTVQQRLATSPNMSPEKRAKGDDIVAVVKGQSRFKKLSKLFGTYVKGIYPLIPDKPGPDDPWDPAERCNPIYKPFCKWPEPWCIHPQYKMNGTDTGRLASADPNGQNFPGKGDDAQTNVKLPYISHWSQKGGLLLQPDYSQIEVRVMVVECGDEKLTEALNAGKDVHRFVASIVHGILEEAVTADIRKPCKTVTFGILYGQTVRALAQALHISEAEGQALVDKFFAVFPKVKELVELQHATVKAYNRVTTRLGRVRWLYHVLSHNKGEANKALRDCVNTPIQSMASDLCWQAMGRVWAQLKALAFPCRPFSIIHDSQTFDIGPGYVMDVMELQYYQMVYRTQEIYPWMVVKPEADFSIGTCWGNLIDVGLIFDDAGQIDHNHMTLAGPRDDVDAVCAEFDRGGLKVAVADGIDDLHPQKEEAEKGKWFRKIHVDRPNPRCLLKGKTLEIVSN